MELYFCILHCFAIFFSIATAVPVFNDTTGKWEYEAGDMRNNASSLSDQAGFFQGDIVGIPLKGPRTRNGVLPAARKWPNAIVPYIFVSEYSASQYQNVMTAMRMLEAVTCLRFIPRTTEGDYIYFENTATGCNSAVGRQGGGQRVSLQRGMENDYCLMPGATAHELLHAIGLWHEHSRIDRDDYVTINLDNAKPEYRYAYNKVNAADSSTYGTRYDYRSLMHYHGYGFTIDPSLIVMTTCDSAMQDVIGRATEPSKTDAEKVNLMYNCQGLSNNGGTGTGTGTGTTTGTGTGTGGTNCQDAVPACINYGNQCQFSSVKQLCKRTCRSC